MEQHEFAPLPPITNQNSSLSAKADPPVKPTKPTKPKEDKTTRAARLAHNRALKERKKTTGTPREAQRWGGEVVSTKYGDVTKRPPKQRVPKAKKEKTMKDSSVNAQLEALRKTRAAAKAMSTVSAAAFVPTRIATKARPKSSQKTQKPTEVTPRHLYGVRGPRSHSGLLAGDYQNQHPNVKPKPTDTHPIRQKMATQTKSSATASSPGERTKGQQTTPARTTLPPAMNKSRYAQQKRAEGQMYTEYAKNPAEQNYLAEVAYRREGERANRRYAAASGRAAQGAKPVQHAALARATSTNQNSSTKSPATAASARESRPAPPAPRRRK